MSVAAEKSRLVKPAKKVPTHNRDKKHSRSLAIQRLIAENGDAHENKTSTKFLHLTLNFHVSAKMKTSITRWQ